MSTPHCVMPDDIDDIEDPRYHMRRRAFSNLLIMYYVRGFGLDGSTCSERLPERTCYFEPLEHVPRALTGPQTYVLGPGGLTVSHRAESTGKDPRPRERQMPKGKKKHTCICIYMYISPD